MIVARAISGRAMAISWGVLKDSSLTGFELTCTLGACRPRPRHGPECGCDRAARKTGAPRNLEIQLVAAPRQAKEVTVSSEEAGARLDQFLADSLEVSRAQARRLLEAGQVELDGRVATNRDKGRALVMGSLVAIAEFRLPGDQLIVPEAAGGEDGPIGEVLARGDGWLAVDKRAGCGVHPLKENETGTVLNAIAALHPEVQGVGEAGLRSGVVHRLDVDTSGALLVATKAASWDRLRAGFKEHRVGKVYRAIVAGNFVEPIEMKLGLTVAQHRPAKVRVVDFDEDEPVPGVRVSIQNVIPLEQFEGASLVEVRPQTGFLHQIRVTLADYGHPVIGDQIYGDDLAYPFDGRQQLHAAELHFEEIDVVSPDPADFAAVLTRLRG
jgi:23S rRNA pseudouridine1911/1915/1917 synthase